MRPILFAFFALFASVASAGTDTFSLQPSTVLAGDEVLFRIDSSDGCFLAESHSVTRNGSQVEMRITNTDVLPCTPAQMTPILYSLGNFTAGTYQVSVVVCVNAPNPCSVRTTLPLTVLGVTTEVATIPTVSTAALILLVAGALALAARSRSG